MDNHHQDSDEVLIFNSLSLDESDRLNGLSDKEIEPSVDLEIIILEDNVRRLGKTKRLRKQRNPSTIDSPASVASDKIDPYTKVKSKYLSLSEDETSIDDRERTLEAKGSEKNHATSTRIEINPVSTDSAAEVEEDHKVEKKSHSDKTKVPLNDDELLAKLERRYRENKYPEVDDDLYIDYMDYF